MTDTLNQSLQDAQEHANKARALIQPIYYELIKPRRIRAGYENGYFIECDSFMTFDEVQSLMRMGYRIGWGINYMIKERQKMELDQIEW